MKELKMTLLVIFGLLLGLSCYGTWMRVDFGRPHFSLHGSCLVLSSGPEMSDGLGRGNDLVRVLFEDGVVLNAKKTNPVSENSSECLRALSQSVISKNLQCSAPAFTLVKCGKITSEYTICNYSNCFMLETSGLRATADRIFVLESIRC